jgi:hypothetical protein
VGAWSGRRIRHAVAPPVRAAVAATGAAPPARSPAWKDDGSECTEAFWACPSCREYNIADGLTYKNNGTLGRCRVRSSTRTCDTCARPPRIRTRCASTEPVRQKMAAFIGADPDEVVLNRSTTEGMKQFTAGLDLKAGDEILMSTHEHGGGRDPWRAREEAARPQGRRGRRPRAGGERRSDRLAVRESDHASHPRLMVSHISS